MLAITNSSPHRGFKHTGSVYPSGFWWFLAAWALACAGLAQEKPGLRDPVFRKQANQAFVEAKGAFEKNMTNSEAGWHFGRAAFDWAEFAADNATRQEIATAGIAACRQIIERNPESAPGHYYLGLNLGQLARTKSIGALKLVRQMEDELSTAAALDARFDHAGPDRSLGILYTEAPGWPASIGNRNKARLHLERAVALDPQFPDNQLSLLEAELKWGERKRVASALPPFDAILSKARKELAGDAWKLTWLDWDQRRAEMGEKLGLSKAAE